MLLFNPKQSITKLNPEKINGTSKCPYWNGFKNNLTRFQFRNLGVPNRNGRRILIFRFVEYFNTVSPYLIAQACCQEIG